jgi:hypothetical protein
VVAGEAGALIALLVLGLMPALTDVSLMVVSEPLFLFFVSLTIWGLVRQAHRPLVAGFAAALGNLVRFAGVFLVAGVAVWQVLQPGSWKTRARRVGIGLLPALLLHLYWRYEGIVPGGGISAGTYGGLGGTVLEGWNTVAAGLMPGLTGLSALVLAVGALLLLAVAWWRARRGGGDARSLLIVCGLLGGLYLGTLAFTRWYVIPDVPFDSRMLLPLLFVLALGAAVSLTSLESRVAKWAVALSVASWGVLAAVRDVGEIRRTRTGGVGYETVVWQESAVATWMRGAGQGRTLFTNDPAGIWFTTGRPSRLLPGSASPDSIRAFQARFEAQPAALVAFDVSFVLEPPSPDSLALALHLAPVARFSHGVVWAHP